MRVIYVRPAGLADVRMMVELLNAIIAQGGTTAITRPVLPTELQSKIRLYNGKNAWFLAEDENGELLGFQYIEPNEQLPSDAADIATFVKIGVTGLGIGSKLFESTSKAAKTLGYRWINATIREDNLNGLAYYQSRGFEAYARQDAFKLQDGTIVNRIKKRFNLG